MRRALAGAALMLAVVSPVGAQALRASVNHLLSHNDAIVLLGTVAGGAVGFGIGRTVWRRTTVYEAPASAKGVGVIVAPILSRHRIGVAGTVTFVP